MLRLALTALLCFTLYPRTEVVAQDRKAALSHEVVHGGPAARLAAVRGAPATCTNGRAAGFACSNVDLLSFLPVGALGAYPLNDIWGWTDPITGNEYALVGRQDGVSVVDVTDPVNPEYVANLPRTFGSRVTVWRDVKVYDHYALVVADDPQRHHHGMQVFDLNGLRTIEDAPALLDTTAWYGNVYSAHNVLVNEASNMAYIVGAGGGGETCGGGLHMVDMQDPLHPAFAGCYIDASTGLYRAGYTHDAQCVIYEGPDEAFQGREICIGANETAISIADVTDRSNPVNIATASYPNVQYAHQGWLTEDQRFFLLDDELDEIQGATEERRPTRTLVWDLSELDDPQLVTTYEASTLAIDHNQYVVDGRSYQANYTAGLRVVDVTDPESVHEIAYFDTYPQDDSARFEGAWSSYPFFESGTVVVSSINEGLFVLRPNGAANVDMKRPADFALRPAYPNPFNPTTTIELSIARPQEIRVSVYDVQGRLVEELFDGFVSESETRRFALDASGLASGVYVVRARGEAATQSVTVTVQK